MFFSSFDIFSISIIFFQYNWKIVESGIKHHNPNPSETAGSQKKGTKLSRNDEF